MTSLDRVASWVIVNRATGEAICETFNARLAETVRQDRFTAIPIATYLGNLNSAIKEQPQCSHGSASPPSSP